MDDIEMKRRIDKFLMEICHYSQMQVFATSEYQKRYLQYQIDCLANELFDLFMVCRETVMQPQAQHTQSLQPQAIQQLISPQTPMQSQQPETSPEQPQQQRIITPQELAQNDGKEGKPAFVAVNGNVYDVSKLSRWAGGNHFGLAAGKDLTNEFMGCHLGFFERLQNVPIVGVLQKE